MFDGFPEIVWFYAKGYFYDFLTTGIILAACAVFAGWYDIRQRCKELERDRDQWQRAFFKLRERYEPGAEFDFDSLDD